MVTISIYVILKCLHNISQPARSVLKLSLFVWIIVMLIADGFFCNYGYVHRRLQNWKSTKCEAHIGKWDQATEQRRREVSIEKPSDILKRHQ